MLAYQSIFRLCKGEFLSDYLERNTSRARAAVESESERRVLKADDETLVAELSARFEIEGIAVDPDNRDVVPTEERIDGADYPSGGFLWNVEPGESYTRPVFIFRVPYSGNAKLLKHQPRTFHHCPPQVFLSDGRICLPYIDFNNADEIKRSAEIDMKKVVDLVRNVDADVQAHNAGLPGVLRTALRERRQRILARHDTAAKFDIPVARPHDTRTVSVPTPRRRRPPAATDVPTDARPIAPAMAASAYDDIIECLKAHGRQMERTPSMFAGKDEEALRDEFLAALNIAYPASATGETYNRGGKTDILLRHDGANIFIAECKLWHGREELIGAVDQLFRYLTWQDSKTAILVFVRNRQVSAVLDQIRSAAESHAQFSRFEGNPSPGDFRFVMHHEGDRATEAKVAVLVFHFPPHR